MEEFDSAEDVRARFEVLRGSGARAGRFQGVVPPQIVVTDRVRGQSLRAEMHVPAAAPFFADHFPRRAVFPATLLLDTQIELGLQLASEMPRWSTEHLKPVRVTDVKIRAFIPPGEIVELRIDMSFPTSECRRVRACRAPARQTGRERARGDHSAERLMRDARRRVAITGLGLVTPTGCDVPATWEALLEGRSGVGKISLFDASGFPVRIAAEVKGFAGPNVIDDRKLLKFASRAHQFALVAAQEAIRDAGIHPTEATAERWACAVGTGMMGVDFPELAELHRHCAADGELNAGSLLSDEVAADPIAFCRSQIYRRACTIAASFWNTRLCNLGAHRLRLGRTGDRYSDEGDPPWRR